MIKFKLNKQKFPEQMPELCPEDFETVFRIEGVYFDDVRVEWDDGSNDYTREEVVESFRDGWWLDVSDEEDMELKKEIGLIE